MKTNLLFADRLTRIAIALFFIGLFISGILPVIAASVLLVVSGALITTGVSAFCPIYWLLGFRDISDAEDSEAPRVKWAHIPRNK